jgi:hypothetical protein
LPSGAVRQGGNHRRPPESTGDGTHESEQSSGDAGILEETSGGEGQMNNPIKDILAQMLRDAHASWEWSADPANVKETGGPPNPEEYPDAFAWMAERIADDSMWGNDGELCVMKREDVRRTIELTERLISHLREFSPYD